MWYVWLVFPRVARIAPAVGLALASASGCRGTRVDASPRALEIPRATVSVEATAGPLPSASVEPTDSAMPPWAIGRLEEHDALDRMMGGNLVRAERLCAAKPAVEREKCVDAVLDEWLHDLDARMERYGLGLARLERESVAECLGVRASERNECIAKAFVRKVADLERDCPVDAAASEGDCLTEAVIRRYSP